MQVYLPDDLYEQVKARQLPASELLQEAVRAEVRRQDLLGETDAYLAGLLAEVGEPSPHERARAEAIARRIAAHRTRQASLHQEALMLVLDSGAVTRLAERSARTAALIAALRAEGLWPPVVPSMVLVECLTGEGSRDAAQHRFLRTCDVTQTVPVPLARRAAWLRARARQGSAVDALVTAVAEPGGTVLTGDLADLRALATHASDVTIEPV